MADNISNQISKVSQKHPDYAQAKCRWDFCEDSFQGEDIIKERTTMYLPVPSGLLDEAGNLTDPISKKAYQAYVIRSQYPSHFEDAVNSNLGLMHYQETKVRVPKKMAGILDKATPDGKTMNGLIRLLHQQLLIKGRIGLCVEVEEGKQGFVLPKILLYRAENILNWDTENKDGSDELNFCVVDESQPVRDGFSWKKQNKYRKISYVGGQVEVEEYIEGEGSFKTVKRTPEILGKKIPKFPLVIAGPNQVSPVMQKPPYLSLAHKCISIYRKEADYNLTLYMQGQDTLLTKGLFDGAAGEDKRTLVMGAANRIDVGIDGDARYIGVESKGLGEQRQAIENSTREAVQQSTTLVDTAKGHVSRQSGSALGTRLAAETATLNTVAISAAEAVERCLKTIAEWLRLDPNEVEVKPYLDFSDDDLSPQDMVAITTAKNAGYPISEKSLHNMVLKNGMTTMSFEEEQALLEKEEEEKQEKMVKIGLGLMPDQPRGRDPKKPPTGNSPKPENN